MNIRKLSIPGCYEINPTILSDERGLFVKTFHKDIFMANGLIYKFAEEYYSVSRKGVLRGLHFQVPPMHHFKIVYCTSGKVFDAIVDIRKGSPAFGTFNTIHMSAALGNMLYLPPGIAHGFYVLSREATLMYMVSSVHSAVHDSGILWNSLGIPWPDRNPVISERDRSLTDFADFQSPFVFEEEER